MTLQKSMAARAWAELLLLSLIWGGVFLAMRIALDEIPVLTAVAHRVFWAAPVLWAVALGLGHRIPFDVRLWGAFLVMGLLNNILPFALIAWAQLHIEMGLASILNAAAAIFGVIVAAIIFADERLTPRRLIGVSLGFLGVAIAIGLGNLLAFDLRSVAQLAVLGACVSYAFASSWARARLGHLPPVIGAAGMLTTSAVIIVPFAWFIDGAPRVDLSIATWGAIAYYALFATALAYLLYYRILAMAGAGNLLLCTLLIPPVAILLGAAFRDEALTATAYLGFVVLALGLMILDGRLLVWAKILLPRGRNLP